jgi:hypothetical protein
MDKKGILELLRNSPFNPGLDSVIRLCERRIEESNKTLITDSGDKRLLAEHFFKIYSHRLKNPNGVASKTPGVIESVNSFKQEPGTLFMISVELDSDAIAIWLSEDKRIVGCIKFLSEP